MSIKSFFFFEIEKLCFFLFFTQIWFNQRAEQKKSFKSKKFSNESKFIGQKIGRWAGKTSGAAANFLSRFSGKKNAVSRKIVDSEIFIIRPKYDLIKNVPEYLTYTPRRYNQIWNGLDLRYPGFFFRPNGNSCRYKSWTCLRHRRSLRLGVCNLAASSWRPGRGEYSSRPLNQGRGGCWWWFSCMTRLKMNALYIKRAEFLRVR